MADRIGAYHLANNPKIYEPARTNTFRFVVTGLDNLRRADNGEKIVNAQEYLEFSVDKASVPNFTQEPISIKLGNSTMKAAGMPEFGDGTLTINDYIGAETKAILKAWQNLSYNVETQAVGLMSDYKKDCWLLEYTPGFDRIVNQYVLHGCWISGLSEGDYDANSGDKRQINVTIQYDWATMSRAD